MRHQAGVAILWATDSNSSCAGLVSRRGVRSQRVGSVCVRSPISEPTRTRNLPVSLLGSQPPQHVKGRLARQHEIQEDYVWSVRCLDFFAAAHDAPDIRAPFSSARSATDSSCRHPRLPGESGDSFAHSETSRLRKKLIVMPRSHNNLIGLFRQIPSQPENDAFRGGHHRPCGSVVRP